MDKANFEKQRKRCVAKVRYESYQAAAWFAEADGLHAYPCPVCKGFHLTSIRQGPTRLQKWATRFS